MLQDYYAIYTNIPTKLKWKFYRPYKPAMLVISVWQLIKDIQNMNVIEISMFRWMSSKDIRKIENMGDMLEAAPLGNKIRDTRLRWFGHIQRRAQRCNIMEN